MATTWPLLAHGVGTEFLRGPLVDHHCKLPNRQREDPTGNLPKRGAVGQEQKGGMRQRAGSPALLRPSSTHAALALIRWYWLDWSLVCTPCPPPVSTSFPTPDRAPSTVSHPDTSCPGIPAPHPLSVLPRQPPHGAAVMLWVPITRPRAPALQEIPGASRGLTGTARGAEGCQLLISQNLTVSRTAK